MAKFFILINYKYLCLDRCGGKIKKAEKIFRNWISIKPKLDITYWNLKIQPHFVVIHISLEEPPKSLQIIVDDIVEILNVADVNKILHEYHHTGKGSDPIFYFYETFLETYDPEVRERRGVYYTPEAVVRYITRSGTCNITDHGFGCVINAATFTDFRIVSFQKRFIKIKDRVTAFSCMVIFMQNFIDVGDV